MYTVVVLKINKNGYNKNQNDKISSKELVHIETIYMVDQEENIIPSVNEYVTKHVDNSYDRADDYAQVVLENDQYIYEFQWYTEIYNYEK